jgi:hypothetical protein
VKLKYIIFLIFLSGCGQSYNSNTFDESVISNSNQAYTVIKNQCTNCHSGYHSGWASYSTDQDWVNAGLVVSGNASSSLFMNRIKNEGGNMPLNGPALTDTDYQTLKDWINNM